MRTPILATGLALALAATTLTGCSESAPVATEAQAAEIAWRHGDVEDALAEAKETGKPVLLYWGAEWCPPCAEMKAGLFKDPNFIAKTQDFIPVYLDGDTAGAQKWGDRFGTSGYPTVIALAPDGSEITRISSATMASELPALLTLAAGRTRSIDAVLADAKADPATLSAEDWKILAGFDWGNDPKRFEEGKAEGEMLDTLARNAPDPAMRSRFALLSLARLAARDGDGKVTLTDAQAETVEGVLPGILGAPQQVMANRDVLSYYAPGMVLALPGGEAKEDLTALLDKALEGLVADTNLSLAERTFALSARVDLTDEAPGEPLKAEVRKWAAIVDKQASDALVRKSVISYAAELLDQIGDRKAAKDMLLAEIDRSETPYYYMLGLAAMAEDEGDKAAAIDWARKAYEASEGPATRVQWAAGYALRVMRLTPEDRDAVKASSEAVLAELAKSPDNYYQRTQSVADRWGTALVAWAKEHDGAAVLDSLGTRMADVCAKQTEKTDTCGSWFKAA
ncbi:thioredoxin family protein [Croceicoccus naphthovorans]|uniref:Uncharacterized protein n=1 Tax=Croceicoccus naphthovorans TaxID=1348774 RepID=A0A0G3XI10_9SPHN|nr:thioredoxin family protein [Croceicoccus naphthovorans]AKM10251.1 hypothetical protein AB433_10185 [Croceicoccus naphthovorans]MBB3992014.1 protein disulfide-isomerase [Croceicoccus naphthovorans]